MDLKKILILSEAVGAGHERAAQALARGLHETYPAVESRVINTGQYLNPWLEKLFVKAYLETLQLTDRDNREKSSLKRRTGPAGRSIGKAASGVWICFQCRRVYGCR